MHGVLSGWRQMLQGPGRLLEQPQHPARGHVSGRDRLLNLVAAIAFTIGGSLFALGAALAESVPPIRPRRACVYFAGGLFFNTGGYASVLQALNPPGQHGWRWWAWEPERVAWVSAALLFAGTIVFGVNLADSFIQGLTAKQENRLIWAPDMVGCALFIVSGHLALSQICRSRVCWKPRVLDWWIAMLNQVGSYLFLISALAAFINPQTSNVVNEAVANWGTFGGALCFASAGCFRATGSLHHSERHASVIAGSRNSATLRATPRPCHGPLKPDDPPRRHHGTHRRPQRVVCYASRRALGRAAGPWCIPAGTAAGQQVNRPRTPPRRSGS